MSYFQTEMSLLNLSMVLIVDLRIAVCFRTGWHVKRYFQMGKEWCLSSWALKEWAALSPRGGSIVMLKE